MTEEKCKKASELQDKLEALLRLKRDINEIYYKLDFVYYDRIVSQHFVVGEHEIEDILNRHDKQIRAEIDEEIEKLKKEIEAL